LRIWIRPPYLFEAKGAGGIFLEISMIDFDELDEGLLKIDGFDEAAVGTACIWRGNTREEVLVYDGDEIVQILMSRDGMDYFEAIEYIEFNIEGAYVGEKTPVIFWKH
jgi:hypothetical protein